VLNESPIFVFSAGWRSGSTLLQRLICSDERTLIWGEPFGDRIPICRLAAGVSGLSSDDPHLKYAIGTEAGDIANQWVANLNPGTDALRKAHLAYCEALFAEPARDRGFDQWGAKWVRLTAAHAGYLKWLYPRAKLLFLVRHPLNAYLSYKKKRWYTVRPTFPVDRVQRFMAHWSFLANSFLEELPHTQGLLLRYEDIVEDSAVLDDLDEYLGTTVNRNILARPVGARNKTGLKITAWERWVCRWLTGPVLAQFGYDIEGGVHDRSFQRDVSVFSPAGV